MLYPDLPSAERVADTKNAESLPPGTRRRTPYKVYEVKNGGESKGYAVSQHAAGALAGVYAAIGVTVRRADHDMLPDIGSYLASLQPEQVEKVRGLLAGK